MKCDYIMARNDKVDFPLNLFSSALLRALCGKPAFDLAFSLSRSIAKSEGLPRPPPSALSQLIRHKPLMHSRCSKEHNETHQQDYDKRGPSFKQVQGRNEEKYGGYDGVQNRPGKGVGQLVITCLSVQPDKDQQRCEGHGGDEPAQGWHPLGEFTHPRYDDG